MSKRRRFTLIKRQADEPTIVIASDWGDKEIPWDQLINCVEVLPDEITDTERLEWLIESGMSIVAGISAYWLSENKETYRKGGKYKTPREAIDAAMKETYDRK